MKAGIVRIKPETALLRERKIQLVCSAAGLDVKRKLIVLFFYAFKNLKPVPRNAHILRKRRAVFFLHNIQSRSRNGEYRSRRKHAQRQ